MSESPNKKNLPTPGKTGSKKPPQASDTGTGSTSKPRIKLGSSRIPPLPKPRKSMPSTPDADTSSKTPAAMEVPVKKQPPTPKQKSATPKSGTGLAQTPATAPAKSDAPASVPAGKPARKSLQSESLPKSEAGSKSATPVKTRQRSESSTSSTAARHRINRIPVTEVFPVIEEGLWPAKAVVGEAFPIRATVFREGHDRFAAEAVLVDPQGREVERSIMYDIAPGLDRYEAWVCPDSQGEWSFQIESWSDPYATWSHDAAVKIAAEVDVELMLEEGARLLERAAAGQAHGADKVVPLPAVAADTLTSAAAIMRQRGHSPQTRLSAGLHAQVRGVLRRYPLRDYCQASRSYPLRVVRERALYSSWYEIFPRSIGATRDDRGKWTSGTLRSAATDLPRIAKMGFDVVYLTPIHPIGTTFRKGKNNTLHAGADDPGSPYAIGSPAGGHDAIHPELGDFADFDFFVAQAREQGLEVALDLALQCSPDHPWVREHPEWFSIRADGSIAYAENPPKKYQDIYPLNFDRDPQGIYRAIFELLEKWVSHGVTIFRVDNPHTKPLTFWQQLLEEFHQAHPEVLFLSEAFTRPAMMRTLAQLGFHQSYTYFAWRNTKEEIEEYFQEVAKDSAHYLRPAFWPTTHDILTPVMTEGGAAAFAYRAVLAATGSPTWGIYSGYEFVEKDPRPGFEEQNNNEKYEFKPRDYDSPEARGMTVLLSSLNRIRREHPALQRLRNITVHATSSPSLVCYSRHVPAKYSPTGQSDTVIVVVNLNPHGVSEGMVDLNLEMLGASIGASGLQLRDELDGRTYVWGKTNYVRLDPNERVAHIFSVES